MLLSRAPPPCLLAGWQQSACVVSPLPTSTARGPLPQGLHAYVTTFTAARPHHRTPLACLHGWLAWLQEVDRAIEMTVSHVNKLREMSPLWEMVQEGVDIKSIQWAQH